MRQYEQWVDCLPRVRPHYAVKCNPDPAILQLLHRLGCGFDTASKAEIMMVNALGSPPSPLLLPLAAPRRAHAYTPRRRRRASSRLTLHLTAGAPSTSLVYANPCKMASHLRFARQQDVRRMTFDNEVDLALALSTSP